MRITTLKNKRWTQDFQEKKSRKTSSGLTTIDKTDNGVRPDEEA